MRRPIALTIALNALGLLLAGWPAPADASGLATFRLANIDAPGASAVQKATLRVIPAGIVPTEDSAGKPRTDSPLKILPDSTGYKSSGLDLDGLKVFSGKGVTPEGDPFKVLQLNFRDGFQPGGRLFFTVETTSPAEADLLRLVLPSSVHNLAIEALPTPAGVNPVSAAPPVAPTVPEPLSVLLWSTVALLGLARAHAFRRSHVPLPV